MPPGTDTISGISGSCAEIGAVAGVGDVLSLVLSSAPIGAVAGGAIGAVTGVSAELSLSSGACAGADADELPFGFSTGTDAVAGNGSGVLALTAGDWVVPAGVGAWFVICFCWSNKYKPPRTAMLPAIKTATSARGQRFLFACLRAAGSGNTR